MTLPNPSRFERTLLVGGPADGDTTDGSDPTYHIGVMGWAWLDGVKLPRHGVYRRSPGEYTVINGIVRQHYVWEGWLWGDDWRHA